MVYANTTLNQWIHITGVLDFVAKTISLYIDGILVVSASRAFSLNALNIGTPNNFDSIGSVYGLSVFNGQLNEPLIYNRALTASEVNANFQATRNKYGI